ncbi:OLC1v1010905C1 [Oldenlandia corymbosa var. corymbosa]|uniref:OLC1v1010905C1 n=1 Tax=Oldenlandia corymbosa var. corymbosa TaxID=529605 RepID=A0AAV1DSH0_OLDCO|nr:OLC1v1010905C1 [Oldenlandia corymbosa var. corymbosa]
MPTFTAIALDRLIEAGTQKTMAGYKGSDQKLDRSNSSPNSTFDRGTNSTFDRGTTVPRTKLEKAVSVPNGKLEQRNGTAAVTIDRKHHWTQISPALYATPEPTPLPDSPSSFPPSPYIINHKRRGPRLLKSYSEDDVAIRNRASDEEKLDNVKDVDNEIEEATNGHPEEIADNVKDVSTTTRDPFWDKSFDADADGEFRINGLSNGLSAENGASKSVTFSFQRDPEADDFCDPQESMSVKSNAESETNVGERSLYVATPLAEFYDAWEELSSENGPQPPVPDIEAELREIRLSLMTEIEKRKQAEETLRSTRAQWQKIREELSIVGLTVPADLVADSKDEPLNESTEDLSLQMEVVRFVSNSIGRGTAKAEVEAEMEAQMELKNFEIARLLDRLHYYEAVNREMSQRNQETIESSRRLRQMKKRRQRWIWGSVATAVTLGAAVLAWSYFPGGKGHSSASLAHASEGDSESSH